MHPQCTVHGCIRVEHARGLCGTHYQRWRKYGSVDLVHTSARTPLAERFWPKVDRSGNCWLWISPAKARRGYGITSTEDGRVIEAHRAAWILATGEPIPDGMEILHTCDTPACVRNDEIGVYVVRGVEYPRRGHLYLGPQSANLQDAVDKGRMKGLRLNGNPKITSKQAVEIRELLSNGETMAAITTQYGIKRCAIWRLKTGRTWQ